MLSNRDWVINIENAAAKVAAEYGQKVVDSVFCRYDAHSLEDLSPCYIDIFFHFLQSGLRMTVKFGFLLRIKKAWKIRSNTSTCFQW